MRQRLGPFSVAFLHIRLYQRIHQNAHKQKQLRIPRRNFLERRWVNYFER